MPSGSRSGDAVLAGLQAHTGGSDADQFNGFVRDEVGKESDAR